MRGGVVPPPPLSPVIGLLQLLAWLRWQPGRLYSLELCVGSEEPSRYGLGPTAERGRGFFGKEDLEV